MSVCRFRNPKVLVTLYKSLEYSHISLEYYQKDKVLLECVQRRFTRDFPDIKDVLSWQTALQKLRLWSFEERINRGDLVEVFKTVKGLSDVSLDIIWKESIAETTMDVTVVNWLNSCRATRTVAFISSHFEWWTTVSGCCWCSVNGFKRSHRYRLRQQRSMGFFMDWHSTSLFGHMDMLWLNVMCWSQWVWCGHSKVIYLVGPQRNPRRA